MLFLNISSDKIFIKSLWGIIILDSQNLEREFPKVLIKLYKKNSFSKIFVLNWPGSFTSLRIGVLSLNLLNFLLDNKIEFYDISKIDFYKVLISKSILPKIWYIYIWQKKKVWRYDFDKNEYEYVEIDSIKDIKNNYFVDIFYWDFKDKFEQNKIVLLDFDASGVTITFKDKEKHILLQDFNIKKVNSLEPNYLIQPSISQRNCL